MATATGRIRLSITKNSRGYGYEFTVEHSGEDLGPMDGIQNSVLESAMDFKPQIESMIKGWELGDAESKQSKEEAGS